MEARQLTVDETNWNNLLGTLSPFDSEFLNQVRKIQMDESIEDKLTAVAFIFKNELVSILSAFFKKPPLNELRVLKDRIEILKKIVTAGFFTLGNESVIKSVSEQINDAYIKALETKIDILQLVINSSKSKLNEKDKVIGWLQTVLNRYESNQQSQSEVSLVKNPNSMWQQPLVEQSQNETPFSSLRYDRVTR